MVKLGINEKSLPFQMSWYDKLSLAKEQGFSFIELSIDETDDRTGRLDWDKEKRFNLVKDIYQVGITIDTMMLSALRKYPLGSENEITYEKSYQICKKAIILARDLGIRNIQIAGYDEYYESKTVLTHENFIENLQRVVDFAAANQVMIAIETMDDGFINSITKVKTIKKSIISPWLQAYPDLGNISAWPDNKPVQDLTDGLDNIVSVHVKDVLAVTKDFPGQFKDVTFGEGDVDFLGLFKTLNRIGYHGTLTIEMWSENDEDVLIKIKDAHEFVSDLLNKSGLSLEV
ncbi:L-ribulose-5-phosphate 3-epimerase [Dellaglioa carnosa]|uniref:L-ribulose-5-phosphate 3-epimerase n=1 Tax=Dellaglioa carnosa TaxID=2995136 RepID=UPI0022A85513|nr:L-ribulose-5-phosphate 3-epimerase [Dellaglioa carnosa]MCZ2492781.1 L-ribulose-5-phosphate 3-epimerase [Dellaglioa carnosa]